MGIILETDTGIEHVPINALQYLLIGPGCSITSAAVKALADHNCTVCWVGEEGIRFYSYGSGATHANKNAQHHARVWADPVQSKKVVQRMYDLRYPGSFPDVTNLSLSEIRGHEGMRVKQAYLAEATKQGVVWQGRKYLRGQWDATDAVNQALSSTSACLYGLCQSVVLSVGLLPSLGFVHTDSERCFSIDLADMYRETVTVPLAFSLMSSTVPDVNGARARRACRDYFRKEGMAERVLKDAYTVLGLK